jgi:hypothetical protein
MSKIVQRIEKETGVSNLGRVLSECIKPTDLQSLLLKVYQERVKRRSPRAVFSDYVSNSFNLPSQCNPSLLLKWDCVAFSHLPEGFCGVELSPVAPLGSVSLLAPISQDWVLTTIRNTEVVSDPTIALAFECALRRRKLTKSDPNNNTPVHLACSHRVVRTQRYRKPGTKQHFRLFSLCSAGRNTEKLRFSINAVCTHIRFYLASLKDFLGTDQVVRVKIIDLSPNSYPNGIFASLENLQKEFKNVNVGFEKAGVRKNESYYRELRFKIYASPSKGQEMELVDGGATDWTQKLLNNAKERLVISAIGSERLCEEFSSRQETISRL